MPHVSIILPVRNEEANIGACLSTLLVQDYPDFDITVIDDGSTDATARLLAGWSARNSRIRVYRIDKLPEGWAGKTHALHMGVMLSDGEWLLFTDADTRHAPQTLRLMMRHALRYHDDLLSMRTTLMTLIGPAVSLLMPLSEVIVALRVTPDEMRHSPISRAFAFGQYILMRRDAYLLTEGYAAASLRSSAIEDVALADHFKLHGRSVEVVEGRGLVMNQQWTTWESAMQGWRKSCYGGLVRFRIPFVAILAAGLALIAYGLGPLITFVSALCSGKIYRVSTALAGITLLAQIDARRSFDREYDLALPWSFATPLGWVLFGVLTLDVARRMLTGRGTDWKGRQLPKQKVAYFQSGKALSGGTTRPAIDPPDPLPRSLPDKEAIPHVLSGKPTSPPISEDHEGVEWRSAG